MLVAYAGRETKIALNSGKTPFKRTRIEEVQNMQVVLNFVLLFAMCVMCGVTYIVFSIAFSAEPATYLLDADRTISDSLAWESISTILCVHSEIP